MGTCRVKKTSGRTGEPTRRLLLLLLFCASLVSNSAVGDDMVVVYPQVREPFAALYRDYLAGIHAVLPEPTRDHAINGAEAVALARDIALTPPQAIIALGNKSLGIADSLGSGHPLVALVANREAEESLAGGILLRPSAEVYLDNLQAVYKGINRVFVVYNPEVEQALVEEARALAEHRGITLTTVAASSMREAASGYRQLLRSAPAYSAIWLLADHGFLDSSMLSTILDVAWERKLIVFSSNPLFVKHGALFAVYPDNRAVGMMVARIALEVAEGKHQPLQTLRDVRLAVNERTLNHLGLPLSADVRARIDLMLPGR